MNRLWIPLFFLLILSRFSLYCEDARIVENPAANPEVSEQFAKNLCLSQEFVLILPAFNRVDEIYSPGFGVSIGCEYYGLNLLFLNHITLPGILVGINAAGSLFLPVNDAAGLMQNYLLVTGGVYTGYQFFLPVSRDISFSPALFAGIKYYFSFHLLGNEQETAMNPLLVAGANLNFIFDLSFNLGLVTECQVYYDGRMRIPVFTIQFALRTGLFIH